MLASITESAGCMAMESLASYSVEGPAILDDGRWIEASVVDAKSKGPHRI
jgi:hypothetical protein